MADTTSLAESSQAFFCAIADYLTIKGQNLDEFLNPKDKSKGLDTFSGFEKKWKSVFKDRSDSLKTIYNKFTETATGSEKIDYGDVEGFLMIDKSWYVSSCLIGKKIVEDISSISSGFSKKPSTSDVWYFRGDKDVMKNIESLFKLANVKKPPPAFGDINKWSPADIYFATDKARDRIKASVLIFTGKKASTYGFDILNNMVSELIDSGDLLPISLKKQTNSVTIKKVNFDKVEEQTEILKYKFSGFVGQWKKYTIEKPQTRDLKIKFSSSDRDYIKIRHDASTATMKIEFESKDMEARGGSIGSWYIFCDIFENFDSVLAKKLKNDFRSENEKYKREAKILKQDFEEKIKRLRNEQAKKMARQQFDEQRGALSALMITNVIFPPLINWLENNTKELSGKDDYIPLSDRFIQELYKYITSRTFDSGKFVIAK
jgi:hypothetical protein